MSVKVLGTYASNLVQIFQHHAASSGQAFVGTQNSIQFVANKLPLFGSQNALRIQHCLQIGVELCK